jgi:hypothetical protein
MCGLKYCTVCAASQYEGPHILTYRAALMISWIFHHIDSWNGNRALDLQRAWQLALFRYKSSTQLGKIWCKQWPEIEIQQKYYWSACRDEDQWSSSHSHGPAMLYLWQGLSIGPFLSAGIWQRSWSCHITSGEIWAHDLNTKAILMVCDTIDECEDSRQSSMW